MSANTLTYLVLMLAVIAASTYSSVTIDMAVEGGRLSYQTGVMLHVVLYALMFIAGFAAYRKFRPFR